MKDGGFQFAVMLCLYTILLLLFLIVFGGCQSKSLHEREWDAKGNLVREIKVHISSCLIHTEAKNIVAVTPKKFLFVGDLSQVPDSEAVKAVSAGLAETILNLFTYKRLGL